MTRHFISTDFCKDAEKMRDFQRLTKQEFLKSYSYLTEIEYNLTRAKEKFTNQCTQPRQLN